MVGPEAREEFLRVLDAMGQKLRSVHYNGSYFDRGAAAGSRLCTPEGWFSCQVSMCPVTGRRGRGPGVPTDCVWEVRPWPLPAEPGSPVSLLGPQGAVVRL